jgi:hypothetical protein
MCRAKYCGVHTNLIYYTLEYTFFYTRCFVVHLYVQIQAYRSKKSQPSKAPTHLSC